MSCRIALERVFLVLQLISYFLCRCCVLALVLSLDCESMRQHELFGFATAQLDIFQLGRKNRLYTQLDV